MMTYSILHTSVIIILKLYSDDKWNSVLGASFFAAFGYAKKSNRECVVLIAGTSLSGARVGRELDIAIMDRMAKPTTVVSDNGTELTSTAILKWSQERRVE